MKPRLLADENTSHALVLACHKLDPIFPIIHIADWMDGSCLSIKDPALLMMLREEKMILVGFDRSTMAMHAGTMTREGLGHSGIIIFRRIVPSTSYGKQAKLLVNFWAKAKDWDWADRIEYLPRP